VAKEFGKKFATGSSVSKVPSGGEEIVVQGDVSEEIEEFLMEKYTQIPEDNYELIEVRGFPVVNLRRLGSKRAEQSREHDFMLRFKNMSLVPGSYTALLPLNAYINRHTNFLNRIRRRKRRAQDRRAVVV
jgi:hypothetical protein